MAIQKLPQYLINKLKAGEIIERPASVVKELIENSIDAGATSILLEIKDWGNTMIKVEDNGSGILAQDLDLAIDRYATSKILNEQDLLNISTYGFRWEALASISEVSKFKIQTKTSSTEIWQEINKIWKDIFKKNISFDKQHWTKIFVEDIFFNTPVRKKFLKSAITEYRYIYEIFINFALVNYNVNFKMIKDDKLVLDLLAKQDHFSRIFDIYKKDREKHIKIVEKQDKNFQIYGIISDANLNFPAPDNIKIFVNKRIINDRIIKKAIIEAYYRQIPVGSYPLATVFWEINPELVDVNVHPRKIEVKFLDPNSVYNFTKYAIEQTLSKDKFSSGTFQSLVNPASKDFNFQNQYKSQPQNQQSWLDLQLKTQILAGSQNGFDFWNSENDFNNNSIGTVKILWQVWDSFILVESEWFLYFIDQHVIAERILFENMKKDLHQNWLHSEILLDPIIVSISKDITISTKLESLNEFWFDISLFSENKIIIYAVPNIFVKYKIDLDILINKLIYMENINLDIVLDQIFATKSCKAAIKAWEKLNFEQMKKLIQDWFINIEGMFVCQHGRAGVIKIPKQDIEKLFGRNG